jgi:hypothetical protein
MPNADFNVDKSNPKKFELRPTAEECEAKRRHEAKNDAYRLRPKKQTEFRPSDLLRPASTNESQTGRLYQLIFDFWSE